VHPRSRRQILGATLAEVGSAAIVSSRQPEWLVAAARIRQPEWLVAAARIRQIIQVQTPECRLINHARSFMPTNCAPGSDVCVSLIARAADEKCSNRQARDNKYQNGHAGAPDFCLAAELWPLSRFGHYWASIPSAVCYEFADMVRLPERPAIASFDGAA
jgi:hypothetical protein